MGENELPTVQKDQIAEIIDFVNVCCDNPKSTIIPPRVYATHMTTMLLIIETIKQNALHMACETKDFRSHGALLMYLESLGL